MSVYYEILMDLLQNGKNDEFLKMSFKYLSHDILSPEEFDRILELAVRSLPEDVKLKLMAEIKSGH
jgi:hypothetical protein